MVNNSATGGYLLPASSPAPLEDQALLRFFQTLIVGITGLPGSLVRPYWQERPPDVPDAGVAWAAFKITKRPSDEYPYVGRNPYGAEDGADHLQRHELLEILTSFYDTGVTGLANTGGSADANAALLRDGLMIGQNREPLFKIGYGLVRIGEVVTLPNLFKQRWQNRVDFEWAVRRQIDRSYPVETLVAATGDLYTDTGLPPEPFNVPSPSE
jgi:hypothetical protein